MRPRRPKPPKPFGYEVQIEVSTGGSGRTVVTKHWRAYSPSKARQKGMMFTRAVRVLKVMPITEAQFNPSHSEP